MSGRRILIGLFFSAVASLIVGCAGGSLMLEPGDPEHGSVSESIAQSRQRGLLIGEYVAEPNSVIEVSGRRIMIKEAWVERNTRYVWRNFMGRLEAAPGERVAIAFERDNTPIGFYSLYGRIAASRAVFGIGNMIWSCVVPVAGRVVEIEVMRASDGMIMRMRLVQLAEPRKEEGTRHDG